MRDLTLTQKVGITNIITDLRTKKIWSVEETKILLLVFKILNKEMKMVSKKDYEILNFHDVDVSEINHKIEFSRSELIEILNISPKNFAREIDRITDSLMDKKIKTTHPDAVNCHESFEKAYWFPKASYSKKEGKVSLVIDELAVKMVIYFIKYSYVDFKFISNIKNIYSLNLYLLIKMEIDSKKKLNKKDLVIDLDDFKEHFNLVNKYRSFYMLKQKVLDVIKSEINEFTDLTVDYSLIKEGRSYKRIQFIFDYKDEYRDKKVEEEKYNQNTIENINEFDHTDLVEESMFEAILTSWGIRAKKIIQLEDKYSINSIIQAIDITKLAIKEKTIKSSPAAFFLGTLENKQLQEEVAFEQEQENLRKEQEKSIKKALASEYDAIQKFINDNTDIISSFLSVKSAGGSIDLSFEIINEFANLACINIEKYKEFRPKLPVLVDGFFDMKQKKEIRPNMYQFLLLIKNYI